MNSQDTKNYSPVLNLRRNAIYGSIGVGVMSISASGYYERIIGKGSGNMRTETFLRVGSIAVTGAKYCECLALDAGLLIGSRRYSMTELSIGWHPGTGEDSDFIPLGGSAAYRYQKPEGKFIFRLGIGYPESLFTSLGFCF